MRTATVRDLRYHFREVEEALRAGEEIQITKRKRPIAKLVPCRPAMPPLPDFMARMKEIYGDWQAKVSGAELIARYRGRY